MNCFAYVFFSYDVGVVPYALQGDKSRYDKKGNVPGYSPVDIVHLQFKFKGNLFNGCIKNKTK